jgi:membrane protein required for beta-lactamase induction
MCFPALPSPLEGSQSAKHENPHCREIRGISRTFCLLNWLVSHPWGFVAELSSAFVGCAHSLHCNWEFLVPWLHRDNALPRELYDRGMRMLIYGAYDGQKTQKLIL